MVEYSFKCKFCEYTASNDINLWRIDLNNNQGNLFNSYPQTYTQQGITNA